MRGGKGSGNFNHKGRPRLVGGSSSFGVNDLAQAYDSLDDNQKRYVNAWADTEIQHYAGLNHYLRTGYIEDASGINLGGRLLRFYQDATKVLDTCFKELTQDVVVYRGMSKSPNWLQGDIFEDKGYVSTTLDETIAFHTFGMKGFPVVGSSFVMYKIKLKKGQKFIGIPTEEEKELLLPRGTKFKVTNIDHNIKDYYTETNFGDMGHLEKKKLFHHAIIYTLEVVQ